MIFFIKKSINLIIGLRLIMAIIILNFLLICGVHFTYDVLSVDVFKELNNISAIRKPNVFREKDTTTASQASLNRLKDSYTFKYNKSKAFAHSFAGIYFPVEDLKIDISKYDRLRIGIETRKAKRIPVNLSLHYKKNLVRYFTSYIDVKEGVKEYDLKLTGFLTPPEWFETNHLTISNLPVTAFNELFTVSIESCHILANDHEDLYKITSIVLKRNVKNLWYGIILLNICFVIGALIYFFTPKSEAQKILHIPIQYSAETFQQESSEISKIVAYLAVNYTDPDLTLGDLQKALGIHTQQISKLLKNEYSLTFPQYLNKLRIEEAKHLLISKQFRSISDIAYKVGFNSPNNFNRVFKSVEGATPGEFLLSLKVVE